MPLTRSQKRTVDQPSVQQPAADEAAAAQEEPVVADVAAAAAEAAPPPVRRVTRSLSTKKRSAAAAAAPPLPPVAAVARPQRNKKARVSGGPIRSSYNLRSKQQQEQQTTVTPGTATRQVNFAGSPAESGTTDHDDTGNKNADQTTTAATLPAGVVDIFNNRPKARCSGLQKKQSKGTCYCPPASQADSIQILSSQHLADYGLEYCRYNELREKAQVSQLLERIKTASSSDASSHNNDTDSEDEGDDVLVDSDDDEDGPVRARRALTLERRQQRGGGGSGSSSTASTTLSPTRSVVDTEPLPRQPMITARMRKILVQWLSEVVVEYRLSDATFHLSISLLDQLLTMGPTQAEWAKHEDNLDDGYVTDDEEDQPWFVIQRKDFQAIGCACLWIAAKIEEVYPPRNERFVYIADYSFTSDKLSHLETRICKLLQYRFQRVTPFHFVGVNLRVSQACEAAACPHFLDHTVVKELTLYLVELSRASYVLSLRKPSLLAAAATYLARATLGIRAPANQAVEGGNEFWTKSLEHYTGYSVQDLTGTALRIHQWHLAAESSPSGANPVFTKYKTEAHLRVSLKTVPRVEDLGLETEMTHNGDVLIDENREVSVQKMAL